ncbi:hypothetical protein ACJMK2_023490 [Sinanodonta woodiana]|uniref:Tubulin polyglutamylase TTLL4 n=1 Tax=Sinanodonta woodiana TaxID=1069815 RepID=A0ABD3T4F2_SINWO
MVSSCKLQQPDLYLPGHVHDKFFPLSFLNEDIYFGVQSPGYKDIFVKKNVGHVIFQTRSYYNTENPINIHSERLPGDGEASLNEDDGDDNLDDDDFDGDDGMGDLEDDYGDSDGGGSDGYSIHTGSSLSRRSSAHVQTGRKSVYGTPSVEDVSSIQPATTSYDKTVKPALTVSLFPNVPPTITFVSDGEKVEQLQWEFRKLLKWRMSPITPNVVKGALSRSGFRATKRNHDWLGCWGKHMKSPGFKALREFQKLNHFPGSFQIGRKDRLWRNLSRMQVHFGKKEFGFFPQTFCLPYDTKQLKRVWEDGGSKQKWIIKPPASARGIGIKVIGKWNQIPRRKPVIVQRYLSRPYLINDSKFDMRVYVYVSCYDPLRLYVYEDGLARFASMKSLKALWNYMKRQGINTAAIWENVKDLIVKTIICADSAVNSLVKANCKSRYCVHELFGFDILLDENLKPWVLEVNISPSLHSNSQLDVNIKGHMIRDLFNIAGFRIPDKHDVSHSHNNSSSNTDFSTYVPPNPYCLDKRLFSQQLAPDERAKHAYYSQRHQDDQALQTILDIMTPDDIRILVESIDEDNRKGSFQRVFPTPNTHKYLRFFEMPRYYNLLLDQYVQRFNRMESRGIAILESFCDEAIHLECPTDNPNHQSFAIVRSLLPVVFRHSEDQRPKITWQRTVEAEMKDANQTWGSLLRLANDRQKHSEDQRPKITWQRTVEAEMKDANQTWGSLLRLANDRQKWKDFVAAPHARKA